MLYQCVLPMFSGKCSQKKLTKNLYASTKNKLLFPDFFNIEPHACLVYVRTFAYAKQEAFVTQSLVNVEIINQNHVQIS